MSRRILIPPDISPTTLRGVDPSLPVHHLEGGTMGTTWRVRCVLPAGVTVDEVQRELESAFALVVRQMSHWEPESDLCRFNHAGAGEWVELPGDFFQVLSSALEVASASDGVYDPTLGRLIDRHGFGAAQVSEGLPTMAELSELRESSGWDRVHLDPVGKRALQPGGVHLNLSSIAKGYAVDLACEALTKLGLFHFLVEIGGELRGAGCKPDGHPWWCVLENPPGGNSLPETVVALCGLSVATSGDTVIRRVTAEGIHLGHLLDPRTGGSASDELAAVTVFHPSCRIADAWATALFVAGSEGGLILAEKEGLPALFTLREPDGYRQVWSSFLEPMLG